jgi:hypothetical protein
MTERLRQSIPTSSLQEYYACGWAYIMPDFDKPDHSFVEWLSTNMPVYPSRVSPETQTQGPRDDVSPHQYVTDRSS